MRKESVDVQTESYSDAMLIEVQNNVAYQLYVTNYTKYFVTSKNK